jgi:signal transduction histidine kinase
VGYPWGKSAIVGSVYGHGLVGIADRASARGGRVEIESPPGGGTRVAADLILPPG